MYAKYDKFVRLHWTIHLAIGLVYFFGCWLIFRFPWPTLAGLCVLLIPTLKSKELAQWFIKHGLTPNQVTIVGFVLALVAFWPLANGYLQIGIMIYLVAVLLDVLDGFMARLSGLSSQKGGFLDSVLDRIADTCLMGALVLHFVHQSQTLWATATLVALTGAYMVSYTRAKAEIFLPICDVGFMGERPDRNFIMISTVIWGYPEWGVMVVMITSWLTAIRRMKFAWDRLEGPGERTARKRLNLRLSPDPWKKAVPEGLLVKHGVCFVPVLHGRLEFALAINWAIAQYQPDTIAVELPRSLNKAAGQVAARLPNISVILSRRGEEITYLVAEPTDPVMEALRRAGEMGLPGLCIDAEIEGYPENRERWPDSYALTRLGLDAFIKPFLDTPPPANDLDLLREQTMAHRLQELTAQGKRVLFVCGLGHARRIMDLLDQPQPLPFSRVHGARAEPANLDPQSVKDVCNELPFLIKQYEDHRCREAGSETGAKKSSSLDRLLVLEGLYREAAQDFRKATGEEIKPWQYRIMRKFRRNWALLRGVFSPDFYQLVLSAKGVGGDEYAHCFYKKAVDYPWTQAEPSWETISLSAADLGRQQKKVSFFKPLRRTRRRLMPLPERPQAREGYPGQWAQMWASGAEGICSHPPEDLIIEKFGHMSGQKALARLAQSNRLVEPFSVSLRDGIDLRETLRRLAEEKIYVYEERNVATKVGAVVMVFDPDEEPGPQGEERFPWKLTWLGEHQDESDMAFYATRPGEDLVGPGISRCVYGGLVMTYPPLRMLDIWTDPFFNWAPTKPERLLLAGADYSQERVIAYLAKRPPSARARAAVQRMGRQIAYLPLGMFSPAMLQKIRYFHVLSGHDVREYAEEYIGKR